MELDKFEKVIRAASQLKTSKAIATNARTQARTDAFMLECKDLDRILDKRSREYKQSIKK
jgi:hypothetical protein